MPLDGLKGDKERDPQRGREDEVVHTEERTHTQLDLGRLNLRTTDDDDIHFRADDEYDPDRFTTGRQRTNSCDGYRNFRETPGRRRYENAANADTVPPPREGRRLFDNPADRRENEDRNMFMELVRALKNKMPMPTFSGVPKEDPHAFRKKAEDYLHATGVHRREWMHEFRFCLEGKARLWYDELNPPAESWHDLMQKFTGRFCIYGTKSEDWYRAWSNLRFDPASDADIEDLITDVKALQRLMRLPDSAVLATLKNLFPRQRLHFFQIRDIPTMFQMLREMFPKNRTSIGTVLPQSGQYAHHGTDERTHDSNNQPEDRIGDMMEQLSSSLTLLANISDEKRDRPMNKTTRGPPNNGQRRNQPYKPSVSKALKYQNTRQNQPNRGRPFRSYSSDRDRPYRSFSNDRNFQNRRFPNHNGRYRRWYGENRGSYRGFDRSPKIRKPKENSKTPNQDKDRCYKCHGFGHFARECRTNTSYRQSRPFPRSGELSYNRSNSHTVSHVEGACPGPQYNQTTVHQHQNSHTSQTHCTCGECTSNEMHHTQLSFGNNAYQHNNRHTPEEFYDTNTDFHEVAIRDDPDVWTTPRMHVMTAPTVLNC